MVLETPGGGLPRRFQCRRGDGLHPRHTPPEERLRGYDGADQMKKRRAHRHALRNFAGSPYATVLDPDPGGSSRRSGAGSSTSTMRVLGPDTTVPAMRSHIKRNPASKASASFAWRSLLMSVTSSVLPWPIFPEASGWACTNGAHPPRHTPLRSGRPLRSHSRSSFLSSGLW